MVICLERGADLHTAQLMRLPLTVSCFSKIQTSFTFLVLAHPDSPRQRAIKRAVLLLFRIFSENVVPFLSAMLSKKTHGDCRSEPDLTNAT